MSLFWEDIERKKRGDIKEKPIVVKMLPPPLKAGWNDKVLVAPKHVIKESKDIKRLQAVMDIECYSNYFLVMFRSLNNNKIMFFELTEEKELDTGTIERILDKYEIITFNGINYDIPMLKLALRGASNSTLKSASNSIVSNNMKPYHFEKEYKVKNIKINHIDLIEVATGVRVSLKIYGARLGCKDLQDLPYEGSTVLTTEQMLEVKRYCEKDLENTVLLFNELQEQILLRRNMSNTYNIDLRSKSDAQIAEEIIKSEITKLTNHRPIKEPVKPGVFTYQKPNFIEFSNPQLIGALNILTNNPFTINEEGRIEMPKELLTLQVSIGNSVYQMGMGGLHSTESSIYHISNSNHIIVDADVASYYPQIILNCGLYPKFIGKSFLDVYRALVGERLEAKYSGNRVKAESLKICVNGSFGKLGSPYSVLYAPELMVQVTVTGQLSLLMLIDALEQQDISVVSGNTDGVVIKCPVTKQDLMREIIWAWEKQTGFTMEQSQYAGIYSRDVNNYIAIKHDGSVKTKGCFSAGSLVKNPQSEICNEALIAYLMNGTSFEETIEGCKDILKFITVRNVKGGAVYKDKYLGKAVRWYYAKGSKDTINYKTNGNQVAKTFGCKPIMNLTGEFPTDVDHNYYIQECYKLL